MKNQIIKVTLVTVLFLLSNFKSHAVYKYTWQNKPVKITLNIPDTSFKDIEIRFIENNLNGTIGSKTEKFNKGLDGQYYVVLTAADRPMRITISSSDRKLNLVHYYVEPGDDILVNYFVQQGSKKISFSGKGCTNFKVKYSIDSMSFADTKPYTNKQFTAKKLVEVLKENDSSKAAYLNLIEKDKLLLSKTMYQLQRANIIGSFTMGGCFFMQMFLSKADNPNELLPIVNDFLSRHFLNAPINEAATYSEDYVKGIVQMVKLKVQCEQMEGQQIHKDFYDFSLSLPLKLREKVLVYYLLSKPNIEQNRLQQIIKESMVFLEDTIHVNYLKRIISSSVKGTRAFNFELSDSSGKIVKLSDFQGKTVFIDFWFTGCAPCIDLAAQLHNVIMPKFKNSDVVFISVNLDTKKDIWIQSLASGKYTSKSTINLFTDLKGFNHPLAIFYSIKQCPTAMIIDKNGLNFTTNIQESNTVSIIQHLEEAINQ
jgi:thiol-disulfide isomerase/thioredoxin